MDTYGRLLPAPNRFPSAAVGKGFKPLADYVHQLGVDYIKADDMSAFTNNEDQGADPSRLKEIAALGLAIKRSGRRMVLSLSPGPSSTAQVESLRRSAQLWRISADFWDRWEDLRKQFQLTRKWAAHTGPGRWADADMLPVGRIGIRAERGDNRMSRLTKDEQITLMSLWAIFRSPLMIGGDLPSNDDFTLKLLTNREVIQVNQNSTGNRELFARGNQIAWVAEVPSSKDKYLAIFNIGDGSEPVKITVSWEELGLKDRALRVRDLWLGRDLGIFQQETAALVNRHGAQLYRLSSLPE